MLVQGSQALTIYRIGRGGLPWPELAQEEGVQFVQIDWAEANESQQGTISSLELHPDFIIPQQLDPQVNLTPLIESLGGQILVLRRGFWFPPGEDAVMLDGDYLTAYLADRDYNLADVVDKAVSRFWKFDLGARFFLQRIRFFPRERFKDWRFIEHFRIGISEGDFLKDGTREYRAFPGSASAFDFDVVHHITENTQPVVDLELPSVPTRYLYFQGFKNVRGDWEIAEFEIYGAGFPHLANYTTNIIDLGASASLGELAWSGQHDPEAHIDLTMRSGADDDPNVYWRYTFRGNEITRFDEKGKLLNRQTYNQLTPSERAGLTYDAANWEVWSPPYEFGKKRGAMQDDKPRRFVQFKADFHSTQNSGGRLEYLQFAVSVPPVATEVLAEITPSEVRAATPTSFTYKLEPKLHKDDLGFDCIEIDTPVQALGVDTVRLDGVEVDFAVTRSEQRGFAVQIPRIDVQRTGELIEVVFRAEIFQFGTLFSGRVFDSQRPYEVHQAVTPGDADRLEDSNTLSVALKGLGEKAIGALRLWPAVFTPNGDGVNDQQWIEYELVNLFGTVPVVTAVYDLSGRKVREIYRGEGVSSRFATTWDGRDAQGKILPPGLYILRLEVEADRGRATSERITSLVY